MVAEPALAPAAETSEDVGLEDESSIYELFMGILTILSLFVMAWLLFAASPQVATILASMDTVFCLIFLVDFVRSLRHAPSKSAYLFGSRPGRTLPMGVFDLLSSIPAAGPFRAFRLFRLTRVARIVKGNGPAAIAREFFGRRAESAVYVIVLMAILVLLFGSTAIAVVEPNAPDSNIKTGGDAFWWAFVTITTVGYGDRFPVTAAGRFVAMLTMAVGIGIFGVLTSFLSTLFLAPKPEEEAPPQEAVTTVQLGRELAALRADVIALSRALAPQLETSDAGEAADQEGSA